MSDSQFDHGYFESAYRDYRAQNPGKKLDHYVSVMKQFLDVSPATVVDLGCGLGAFAGRASMERNWSVVAVDLDEEVIAHNRRRFPDVVFRVGSATEPGLSKASFDAVSAWDVIEHVPNRDAARSAMRGLLKPGGFAFVVVPVYDGLSGPLIRRLDKDPTHVHRLGRLDWLTWMAEEFEVVHWHGVVRYLLPGGHYLHWPIRWARTHTPAILIVARAAG